jgi:hypothetical protein
VVPAARQRVDDGVPDTSDRSEARRQRASKHGADPRWPSWPYLHGAQLLEWLGKTYTCMALRMEFYGGRTAPTYW